MSTAMMNRSATVGSRGVYAAAGLLALAAAWSIDGWSWLMLAAALAPDAPLFFGAGAAKGQLAPRAVPFYNATHRLSGPVLALLAGVSGAPGASWLVVVGFAWAAHVFLDRAMGYGLRGPDGWRR